MSELGVLGSRYPVSRPADAGLVKRVSRRGVILAGVSLAVLAGVTPVWAQSLPGIDEANKVVRVGAFAPITGPVPFYATINHAADAYFKHRNEQGGISGWKVEYIIRDDGYDPAQSLAVTRRLVDNDDVFALVASNGTAPNVAVIPYARSKNLPVIAPSGGSPKIIAQPNMFPLLPDYALSAASSAQYALDNLGKEKIALIWENDELGRRAKYGLELFLDSRGLAPVADVSFDVAMTDLSPQLQRVSAAGAEVILLFGSNAHLASALRAADRISWEGDWFAPFFTADPATYDLAGELLDGVYFSSWLMPVDSDREAIVTYRSVVPDYYPNDKLGVFGLNGWSAASLFAVAFETLISSGEAPTRDNMIAVMNALDGVPAGAADKVTFEEGDHRGTRQEMIIQAKDGKFTEVRGFAPYPEAVFNAIAE
ncbi:ABC transporter substrate-binding protein [Acuticoccus kandeliae]|uniref:ABC transporter substrate-binding protein n=1 Tax=Acuticoccus kandeliae TaxID=2073160 RepID=UPI000D3E5102|nr:ABC transporter substrate-binding protein [Acuticoccus kandeliae]